MYIVKVTKKKEKDVSIMTAFQEKMIIKGFNEILNYEVGGWLNELQDYEEYTEEDFKERVTHDNLMKTLDYELKEAYKRGYLEVDSFSGHIIEAKHIKFLGKAKIQELMTVAVLTMLADDDVKSIIG